jgi:hypothetical protein
MEAAFIMSSTVLDGRDSTSLVPRPDQEGRAQEGRAPVVKTW